MDTVPPAAPVASDPAAASSEDKTVAIVAYLTLIGFVVAIILHQNKKTKIGSYHLRQSLGLLVTFFAFGIISMIPLIGWLLFFPLFIFGAVLWVMGIIAAASGQFKPVPVLGAKYQQWFSTAFE